MSSNAQIPAQGSLATFSLVQIFAQCFLERNSGILTLERDQVKKVIYFLAGAPVHVQSNLQGETLGQYLLKVKKISPSDLDHANQLMMEKGLQAGEAFEELGKLTPTELYHYLKYQTLEKILECFEWEYGFFQFGKGSGFSEGMEIFEINPILIIQEGAKRHFHFQELALEFDKIKNQTVHPIEQFKDSLKLVKSINLKTDILSLINGQKTVYDILNCFHKEDYESAFALFYTLIVTQLVELRKKGEEELEREFLPSGAEIHLEFIEEEEEMEVEFEESEIEEEKPKPVPEIPTTYFVIKRTKTSAPPPSAVADFSDKIDPELRKLRDQILDKYLKLKRQNYFELLEVQISSSASDIQQAFRKLEREYHSEALVRLEEEVRDKGHAISKKMQEAAAVLTDKKQRKAYEDSLVSYEAARVTKAGDKRVLAEHYLQRGMRALAEQDFMEAERCCQKAVEFDPREAQYYAYLGWAIYKNHFNFKREDPRKAAKEHLFLALELNSRLDKAHLFLGYIFKDEGQPEKAEKSFRLAVKLNPNNDEAVRESRLIRKKIGKIGVKALL